MAQTLGTRRQARSWGAAVLTASVLALAGCGTLAAPGSPGTAAGARARAGRTLCADPGAVGRVVVSRVPSQNALSARGVRRVIKVTVTSPSRARRLAGALCALPVLPKGIYQCPLNALGGFRLSFSTPVRRFGAVTIEPGGCETVRGIGRVRTAARNSRFWVVLAQTSGITSAVHARSATRHN